MRTLKKRNVVFLAVMLCLFMAFTVTVNAASQTESETQSAETALETTTATPLTEYWSADSPVAESLRAYVAKVTDENDQEIQAECIADTAAGTCAGSLCILFPRKEQHGFGN